MPHNFTRTSPLLVLLLLPGFSYGLPEFSEDETKCPFEGDRWLTNIRIPWGIPGRAELTLPPEVRLGPSTIPGAGRGVFATTFIPRYTWLAEYEGEILHSEDDISDYAWFIYRDGEVDYLIDAMNEETSSWLRWINCSRHSKEENVEFFGCKGKGYYMSTRDLYPGQELLVYYGDNYAETQLDIDVDNYHNMDVDISLYKSYACWDIQ